MIPLLAQERPLEITTPHVDWFAISPIVVLVFGALLLLLVAGLTRSRPTAGTYAAFTVVTAGVAAACSVVLWQRVQDDDRGPIGAVADAVVVDGFSVFFFLVIAASVALTALIADDYLRRERIEGPEFYVLLLLSAAGGMVMAAANDLIVLFLGLEILSIALYVLAGYHARRESSREAALKYFVLGSFSSAFFLYGIALVYGATGSTNLGDIAEFLAGNVLRTNGLLLAGFGLMLVGLGFKTSAAPFHAWTPDVYQGSPSPVTGFMASASKAAAFAGLLRVFVVTFGPYRVDWQPVVWVLAVLTLVVGSFLAVVQRDVKRMLAYSSVSHAGYILVGVHAASDEGVAAALFYVLAYTFMVVGSFAIVSLVGRGGGGAHDLGGYRGLGRRRPSLALAFTVLLLAQAGVPLTSGFLAKFYVISAAVDRDEYVLAVLAMLAAVVAAFLYLRIIVAMYMSDDADAPTSRPRVPVGAGLSLAAAVGFTLVVGILPGEVVEFARDAVPVLIGTAR